MTTTQHSATTPARLLAGMLAGVGATHFVWPKPFDALIPAELPGNPRIYTHGSGLAEVVTAGLLAAPRTRRVGGLIAALLFIAVFPGNLNAVRLYWAKPWLRAAMIARLPLQIPMIVTALRVWRTA
ncbi:hypothetical protein KIH27_18005 [Mycobacterium sp. M1]|uniref:DoxX family protein n=1 Tax=Mycolicibacter acidiphilus TaxID=2835306 RepID=A0ABS5RMF2_9MYCO|nr:hypothetical protein [Mycolicibacter acidiphilus]MBS9535483.1 hypothetical protein [Mycolicibacter acidiphilus]